FALPIEPAFVPRFVELGREIKAAIEAQQSIVHPLQQDLEGIYGVIFTSANRNVTVFADGEIDRSPCGSGTSARLALMDRRGELDSETRRDAESPAHRTTIWIVATEDGVYIRSFKGKRGRWYQEALANPLVTIHVGRRHVPARAEPETGSRVTRDVNAAYRAK